jgi:transposase-like protein
MNRRVKMTRYGVEEKAKWLEDWKKSGKSARTYAKENGINPQTFSKWTKRKEGPGFVEIPPARTETPAARKEIVIEKGDIKIHLPPEWPARELCAVLESLGSLV